MLRLFYRDGTAYLGATPHTFKPIKGEARVRIYDRQTWTYRNITIYTAARLDALNARRRAGPKRTPSQQALIEVTKEFKRFARERDKLITEIFEFSALSPTLQSYVKKIDDGNILCPAEIRNATLLVAGLK